MTGLIFGFDDNGLIKPIRLDASRNIGVKLAGTDAALLVYGEETTRQVKTAVYGRTTLGLRQSPMVFGYYGGLLPSGTMSPLLAGTNSMDIYVGAADEVGVITNLTFGLSATRAGTSLFYSIYDGVNNILLYLKLGPVVGEYYDRQGQWVIPPSCNLRCWAIGATAGDAAYFQASGYKMKL